MKKKDMNIKKGTLVNKEIIVKLDLTKKRLDNYIKFYGDKTFTKQQFMGLKNLTQEDKLWIAFRLMPKESIKLSAADIAESVLYIFEQKYPTDYRPRQAIEATRNGKNCHIAGFTTILGDADAAHAADCAISVADSAMSADIAAYIAYIARSAYIAYIAHALGAHTSEHRKIKEKSIRKIVLKYWK